ASAGLAGWMEFLLLRRALNRRIGETGLASRLIGRLWAAAAGAAGAGWIVRLLLPRAHPIVLAGLVLSVYGAVYFLVTDRLGIPEARAVVRRILPKEPRTRPDG